MSNEPREVRPWLAAALSLVLAGLGHLYLGALYRAVGWFSLFGAMAYFTVPMSVLTAPLEATALEVLPVLVVIGLATVDAFLRARRRRVGASIAAREACPQCGRDLDPDLSFCHWCTHELSAPLPSDQEG